MQHLCFWKVFSNSHFFPMYALLGFKNTPSAYSYCCFLSVITHVLVELVLPISHGPWREGFKATLKLIVNSSERFPHWVVKIGNNLFVSSFSLHIFRDSIFCSFVAPILEKNLLLIEFINYSVRVPLWYLWNMCTKSCLWRLYGIYTDFADRAVAMDDWGGIITCYKIPLACKRFQCDEASCLHSAHCRHLSLSHLKSFLHSSVLEEKRTASTPIRHTKPTARTIDGKPFRDCIGRYELQKR